MLITYFDEVKYDNGNQSYYWLGGLVVDADTIWHLEKRVADLSLRTFQESSALKNTEFHATDICYRKRNFKDWADPVKRVEVLKELIDIIDSASEIGKIFVRVDPARMVIDKVEEMAFMFFVERVQMHLKVKQSPGILIGDRENERMSGLFSDKLSNFRTWNTPYEYGISLTHVLTQCTLRIRAHSRMLQLADVYVWTQQLCASGNVSAFPRKEIFEHVKERTRLLHPTRYKEWPTRHSRIQVTPAS